MRWIAGLVLLGWALGTAGGSVAVILGRVGEPAVPWRRVFMGMGGVLSFSASLVFLLGALGILLERERLKLFSAFTGLSGTAFAAGCLVASALVSGPMRWALPAAGLIVGAASVYALGVTLFRRARWGSRTRGDDSGRTPGTLRRRRAMTIRAVRDDDLPALRTLFASSVHAAGPESYTPDQIAMWASFAGDEEGFRRFVLDPVTLVAEGDGAILGFAGIAGDGHVASLYVHGDHQRRGIGSALLDAVLAHAALEGITRLHTEASEFSRPLFERYGFRTVEVETVDRGPARFRRYRMRREAGGPAGPGPESSGGRRQVEP